MVRQVYPLIRERNCQGPQDLPALNAFLQSVRPPGWLLDYPTVNDLAELAALPDACQNIRLWFLQNSLAAFAILQMPYQNVWFEISVDFLRHLKADTLFDWVIHRLHRIPQNNPEVSGLETACRLEDTPRVQLLLEHGFQQTEEVVLRMQRDLSRPIPHAPLPPGFVIRPAAGPEEDLAWVALHQAAHGTQNLTLAERQAMTSTAGYDPTLDLVLVAPDGTLSGYCVCGIYSPDEPLTGRLAGYTDPMAMAPAYQRHGLGKAMLVEGLHRLRDRGVEVVSAGTSSQNAASKALFASCGFQVTSQRAWFRLELYSPNLPYRALRNNEV